MNYKKITIIFIISVFLIIGAYDIFAIYKGGTEASISNNIILWSYKFPAFTFFMGFLCGHLFWRMKGNNETRELDSKVSK